MPTFRPTILDPIFCHKKWKCNMQQFQPTLIILRLEMCLRDIWIERAGLRCSEGEHAFIGLYHLNDTGRYILKNANRPVTLLRCAAPLAAQWLTLNMGCSHNGTLLFDTSLISHFLLEKALLQVVSVGLYASSVCITCFPANHNLFLKALNNRG